MLVEAIAERAVLALLDSFPVVLAPTLPVGSSAHHIPFGGTLSVTSLSFSRDGQFVLSGSLDRTARLLKLTSSDKPVVTVKAGSSGPAGVKVMKEVAK